LGEESGESRAYKVLSSISGLIGCRLGVSMEGSWEQDDECPYCRDPFEITQVKFGFNCISFVSACPNCRLVSISRTTERDKLWLLLSNVAQAVGASHRVLLSASRSVTSSFRSGKVIGS
jgi:hypothetical protein